ncbi:type II 3-dehydroquinate dehydratase [Sphingobium terrigena]|nr:type II 3-dehydroquinate dehydratase [Sphingobium terrigena]
MAIGAQPRRIGEDRPVMGQRYIHILNGPNLNLLGVREPEIYGRDTLVDVEAACRREVAGTGLDILFRQSNAEHDLVGWLHEARVGSAGIVINPAAFSYAAYPILDALKMCECPVVEVHISNIHRRDAEWRSRSIMTQVVTGIVSGLGTDGYALAVRHLVMLDQRQLAA